MFHNCFKRKRSSSDDNLKKKRKHIDFRLPNGKNWIKMSKVLFMGDIHIKHNNLSQVKKMVAKLPSLAEKEITFIVVSGDILDTHEKIDSQLMNRAYHLVRELRKLAPTYVIVGNHDYINNQQFLTDNHWMNGMKEWKDVYVIDTPTVVEDDFVLVPYVAPGRFVEALDHVSDWKSKACIFAHQEIRGCKMGAIESRDGDEWDLEWPSVISGHIHERQSPQKNVYYPGSVLNHAFGYDSQGLSIFSFPDFAEDHIDLGFEKKKIVYAKINAPIDDKDLLPNNKFSLAGSTADIAAFKQSKAFRKMRAKNVKVVFRLDEDIDAAAPKYLKRTKKTPFPLILSKLIARENDSGLQADYKTVVDC